MKDNKTDLLKDLDFAECRKLWNIESDFDKFYKEMKGYSNVKPFTKEEAFETFKMFTGLSKLTLKNNK